MSAAWRAPLGVALLALGVHGAAAWVLGPGPFGPDGAGAQAAAALGGHPYPLHPALIGVVGSGRVLSLLGGALAAGAAAALGARWGAGVGAGLGVALHPLVVLVAATAGGDAPALGLALLGLALCARGGAGGAALGGLLAGLSLGVKPVTLTLLPLAPALARGGVGRGLAALGVGLGAALWRGGLEPLWRPRPRAGLLGSWWQASAGEPPTLEAWPALLVGGLEGLVALPGWTLLAPALLLGAWGALRPGPERGARALLAGLGLAGLLGVAALLGPVLRPRYLAAALCPLLVLAGVGLGRAWALTLLGLAPAAALLTQLGALRAQEEGLPPRPALPWPGALDVEGPYLDSGVCGAGELRALAAQLAVELPPGGTLALVRLRDGRQGELAWPLQAARPDLRVVVLHAGCCPPGGGCAPALAALPWPRVAPVDPGRCRTPALDPAEQALVLPAQPGDGVYGLRAGAGPPGDPCAWLRQPLQERP